MDENDYYELARFIRDRLEELGLDDIGDLRSYMEEKNGERSAPGGKALVKSLLDAFDRYLALNSSETVDKSLRILGRSVESGEPPSEVLVYPGEEGLAVMEGRKEPEQLPTLGYLEQTRMELTDLKELLMADPDEPAPESGV